MKTKSLGKISLLFFLALTLGMQSGQDVRQVQPLTPQPTAENGEMTDETPAFWFVELLSPPLADGGSRATISQERAAFKSQAKAAKLQYTERYSFENLWNGLSIQLEKGELVKLSRIAGVKAIYPVVPISLPQEPPGEETIELYTALAMTGADIAQSELGYTGQGIRVAVVDTGIDYDHPDLGGGFGPGYRVVTGYDFVGDAFNADSTSPSYNPVPVPDNDPDDCGGHGTHVSGIIGANGAITGVAPNVNFGAYRVFGCQGSTLADIMIAAMERALADDMDVLNMSIGSAYQWPEYPTAQAADRLVNRGVVVVCSIGNNGANGLYAAGAPGLGRKVIGTASYDNTHDALPYFTITPDSTKIGYTPATGAPLPPTSGSYSMARTGTPTTTNDGCSALPAGSLTGKAVLIRRGTCSFYIKAMNARNAGAAAVVLYNNSVGRFNPTVAPPTPADPPVTIPVVAISDAEGVLINNRLAAGPVDMTWTDQLSSFRNYLTGGLISSFSSYGLSPDLNVKPDIGAPGGSIRSTYPIELGSYATLGGTSMASPHVAGAAALLLEAKPHTPAQIVRTILQNSADPKAWWGNPALGLLDNVHRQGAGMLDIDDTIMAQTKIEPGKIALGEGESGPQTVTLKVENSGMYAVTYDLSYVNALSTGGIITPSFFISNASVVFALPSITVPAGSTAAAQATIYPATGPANGQYGGYIIFTAQESGEVYRVPFAGFVGDYQGIQVLAPTANGFPWLAKLIGSSYVNQPSGGTFTMAGTDIPYFLIHLDHQSRLLRMEVSDAMSGKSWHRSYQQAYVPRNSTSTSFFAFPWDGKTFAGNKTYTVPDGQYIVKLSVLKALGDENNPAHWEIWPSPVITIDRP